jgi:DNA-binding response OmpR family regulator
MASPRPTILVVDDEPDLGALLAEALSEEFDVLIASDAAGALATAERTPPALVLLDLRMAGAGLDGFDFVELYQDAVGAAAAPIVVISALPLDQQKVLEPRVAGFLPKPFGIAELIAFVGGVLGT